MSGPPAGTVEPGPVWHASVAPRRAYYGAALCEQRAERALASVGDRSLGEWREWSGSAFHLRRRLTVAEQERVGPVKDIRRSPEATRRASELGKWLAYALADVLADEVGVR